MISNRAGAIAAWLAVLMVAVVLLVVQGLVIDRLAGIPYPLGSPRPAAP